MIPEIPDNHVVVGQIATVWGLKGDVKVKLLTDFPDRVAVGKRIILGGVERRIKRSRVTTARDAVLAFTGVDSRNAAEALRGLYITLPIEKLPKLEDDTYYFHELIGLRVETADGAVIGTVSDVMQTGANDVYIVDTPQGELLLPAIYQVVKEIELANGRMIVELMPGLEPTPKIVPKKMRPPRRKIGGPQNAAEPGKAEEDDDSEDTDDLEDEDNDETDNTEDNGEAEDASK